MQFLKSFGRRDPKYNLIEEEESDSAMLSQTLTKLDKKKGFNTGTMKPMSAHDQKTLDTAVALCNEITTKSMNDLGGDKLPNSPSERSKFNFKFPHLSLHHNTQHDTEKDNAAKQERRNFSEEANSVPDIQSTITEESKLAYTSLIEQPTPSSSLITHMSKDAKGMNKPNTMPKPAPRAVDPRPHHHSFQKYSPYNYKKPVLNNNRNTEVASCGVNELPLPPRSTKPKLVDKPRHVRKYPLKLPIPTPTQVVIYQNAMLPPKPYHLVQTGDVIDGISPDTNPFNPFNCFLEETLEYKDGSNDDEDGDEEEKVKKEVEGNLVKDCTDHVSVEDLLEFADHKPCGRQRGVESDEVRIMNKVLKEVPPEECLQALELCEWDVHHAIKLIRVKNSVEVETSLEECSTELANANGDLTKAAAALVLNKDK